MIDKLFIEKACSIIHDAGKFLVQEQFKLKSDMVETKAFNSLVTYVDKQTELQLVEGLRALLPNSFFLTEEDTTENKDGEWQWIIDPLDGTTNYIHKLPMYSISVALRRRDEIVAGIVHLPVLGETFTATKAQGAWLNGSPISISKNELLLDGLLSTGFPYYDFDQLEPYLSTLKYLMKNSRGIRRMGSAAIDLCYTACGKFDGYFEYSLSPWDVAAGALIVQEAGGTVCDFSGKGDWLFGKEICAGNPTIVLQLLNLLSGSKSEMSE